MKRFLINETLFPELKGHDIEDFKAFMKHEFSAYLEKDSLMAHNDGDSHWFTKQYLDAKNGDGIYHDWFTNKNTHPVS